MLLPADHPSRAAEPWLIYDNRQALGNRAGLHALLGGISDYTNLPAGNEPDTPESLGMRRLSAAAITAYLILDWLLAANAAGQLELPLATCRVLLAPTPAEIARTASLANRVAPSMAEMTAPRCTTGAFTAAAARWRDDAKAQRTNATLFYFVGHGLRGLGAEQLLLFDSFGAPGPIAPHAVDMSAVLSGMAPHQRRDGRGLPSAVRPEIARTQFYFVDACRSRPEHMPPLGTLRTSPLFEIDEPDMLDDRDIGACYAALPGASAQLAPFQQTLFSIALLRCLRGEGATQPRAEAGGRGETEWRVSSMFINAAMKRVLDDVNREFGGAQYHDAPFGRGDATLCYLQQPPELPVRIHVEPEGAVGCTAIEISGLSREDGYRRRLAMPPDRHPYVERLRAGRYHLSPTVTGSDAQYLAPGQADRWLDPFAERLWKISMKARPPGD